MSKADTPRKKARRYKKTLRNIHRALHHELKIEVEPSIRRLTNLLEGLGEFLKQEATQ